MNVLSLLSSGGAENKATKDHGSDHGESDDLLHSVHVSFLLIQFFSRPFFPTRCAVPPDNAQQETGYEFRGIRIVAHQVQQMSNKNGDFHKKKMTNCCFL